jgi:two-component system sensor histidine kinase VanS
VQPHDLAVSTRSDIESAVLLSCAAGVALVVLSGLVAGWFLTRRLLAPLRALDEAAARVAEGDLGHRIEARGPNDELHSLADSFDTMTARLERSFGAQRRFTANASHELLTPLTTTRTVLHMLSAETPEEELRELVPMLAEANDRSIGIVRSLLRLAQVEHSPLETQRVGLDVVAAEAAQAVTGTARQRGVRVEVEAEPVAVEADPVLLRQLLANLLENALAYNTADGRVLLRVREKATPDGARTGAVLEVSNTGPAVSPEAAERLFEPFYRAEGRIASATRDGGGRNEGGDGAGEGGYGLGLSVVAAIVRAHRGRVGAVPRPGGGLTVTVRLPVPPPVGRRG